MLTCRYAKSIRNSALYHHLNLAFLPGLANLLMSPKAKVVITRNIPSTNSLTLARKDLPYFTAPFSSCSSQQAMVSLSLRMPRFTGLEVCLRGRIFGGSPDSFRFREPRMILEMAARMDEAAGDVPAFPVKIRDVLGLFHEDDYDHLKVFQQSTLQNHDVYTDDERVTTVVLIEWSRQAPL
ncbi:hypothetical protein BGZ96_010771 [Linnemannia gamsii]|uniref:Uncharacterized protein n=1 Tax=Linnemannia gamsii TaxID=64522 RepID=A0ABQ7KDD4_9FUNG|nr:hypothetical protein BGZ96_010771 [Linnemannia gamsii]